MLSRGGLVLTSLLAGLLIPGCEAWACRKTPFQTSCDNPSFRHSCYGGKSLQKLSQRQCSRLCLHPTAGASFALTCSSLVGMQLSRWIRSGGILGTLVSAAVLGHSFSQYIPNSHPLYDLCFTLFLPGSLTLLLLAHQQPEPMLALTTRAGDSPSCDNDGSVAACIQRVAVPFFFASLSSLLGCWLSFQWGLSFQWFGVSSGGGASVVELQRARAATACLSASYVGGSVNCMATARLVNAPEDLVGSLVMADLITMAVYFSFLSSSLEWQWLVSRFRTEVGVKGLSTMNGNTESNLIPYHEVINGNESDGKVTIRAKLLVSIPLLLGTFGIVQLANSIEGLLGKLVPETACAIISIIAPLFNARVNTQRWWRPFSTAAERWSEFFFLSFFASLGIASNLPSALSMGPACLLFSANALLVHVIGTVVCCLLWKRLLSSSSSSIELEDVWIASNAAIGGPATAAAFCRRMTTRNPSRLHGRTISATVWGVVGYAIGTMLGVGMYRIVGG